MIYLTSETGAKIVVLEPGNLEELRKGRPATTPDKSVLIAFTPDPVWLADKLLDCDGSAAAVAALIEEAAKRPEKPAGRPKHDIHTHRFGG